MVREKVRILELTSRANLSIRPGCGGEDTREAHHESVELSQLWAIRHQASSLPVKVHVLQHVSFEGLGNIEPWLHDRGAQITYTRFDDPAWKLPPVEGLDLVISLGGPMSVNDEAKLPWLAPEKAFVREAIQLGVPTLGICLGAQLMANALGARVYPGPQKEIGWFPVEGVAHAEEVAFEFPATLKVFHWHGETFDLPQGAIRLAQSAVCANQAFQYGKRVLALQFHLETTPESLESLVTHCGDELVGSDFIQDVATLRAASAQDYESIHDWMVRVLEHLM